MAEGEFPVDWELTVRRIAKIIAQWRFPGTQLAQDLCDEAQSFIWEKRAKYHSEKGSFPSWCHTVLNNRATDMLREWRQRRRVDGVTGTWSDEDSEPYEPIEQADPRWDKEWGLINNQLDGERQFSRDELELIETLPLRRRVIALALMGLWRKVPEHIWNNWLDQACIQLPFPPDECSPANKLAENVRILAASLGDSEDAIRQHFYRARNVLKRLNYDDKRS